MTEPQRLLGTYGVRARRGQAIPAFAANAEQLGFGTVWIGGSPDADLREVEATLDATDRVVVATGIVNIWRADARAVAAAFRRIEQRHPGRFLLGVGSGHREADQDRQQPLDAMAAYLDVLDAEDVPADRRLISALGPRMLSMAAARSRGTHPYLTPPAHTRWAREQTSASVLIAPDIMLVADENGSSARVTGRSALAPYLRLSNYTSTMLRSGFGQADLANGGSDALVDTLTPWGSQPRLARAAREHLEVGADHICIQVLASGGEALEALAGIAHQLGLR